MFSQSFYEFEVAMPSLHVSISNYQPARLLGVDVSSSRESIIEERDRILASMTRLSFLMP
jgi:hypothetical protein